MGKSQQVCNRAGFPSQVPSLPWLQLCRSSAGYPFHSFKDLKGFRAQGYQNRHDLSPPQEIPGYK